MKICVAQTRPVKGDVEAKIADHKKIISLAITEKADIIIFAEMSLTGYEPGPAKEPATTKDDSRFDDFQTLSNTHNIITGVRVPVKDKKYIVFQRSFFNLKKKGLLIQRNSYMPMKNHFL